MTGLGAVCPTVQEIFRVVPSATERSGAGLVISSEMGMARSPKPVTFNRMLALYVPGAKVSATVVELNRIAFGTLPDVVSTVSQMGNVLVSTMKNGAGVVNEVTLTST